MICLGIPEFLLRVLRTISIIVAVLVVSGLMASVAIGLMYVSFALPVVFLSNWLDESVAAFVWLAILGLVALIFHVAKDKYHPIKEWFYWQFVEPFKKKK